MLDLIIESPGLSEPLGPVGHPNNPSRSNDLGNSLLSRFEHFGDLNDFHKSVSMKQKAVDLTPADHPDKPSYLNNLGNSLHRRFGCLGDLDDLNKSVSMYQNAVDLTPAGHPDKPSRRPVTLLILR